MKDVFIDKDLEASIGLVMQSVLVQPFSEIN